MSVKKGIVAVMAMFFAFMLLIMCVAGGGEQTAVPVNAFATEAEAYAYQLIGSELGIPWDIAILADGISAYAAQKKDLSDYNPMVTSLQFCIVREEEFIAVEMPAAAETPEPSESPEASPSPEPEAAGEPSASPAPPSMPELEWELPVPSVSPLPSGMTGKLIRDTEWKLASAPALKLSLLPVRSVSGYGTLQECMAIGSGPRPITVPDTSGDSSPGSSAVPQPSDTPQPRPTASPTPEPTPTPEPVIEWVSSAVTYYTGTREILDYIGERERDLNYRQASSLVEKINETAEDKNTDIRRYEVTLLVNEDFEDVLRSLIGMEDGNIRYVLELYDANYMASLYGYTYAHGDIILPDIVQGNVSRAELAAVAVSLINHPYLMGGKSNETGAPAGPLDCSGYVDWVYVQCFGVTVGGSSLPDGVAVSGTAYQWYASEEVSASELKVGDLGFLYDPGSMRSGQINHVGIYLGTYNGKTYWIHCGGSSYGTDALPKGRVGISVASGNNSYNPVDGSTFSPAMKNCRFRFYRRPRFTFTDD